MIREQVVHRIFKICQKKMVFVRCTLHRKVRCCAVLTRRCRGHVKESELLGVLNVCPVTQGNQQPINRRAKGLEESYAPGKRFNDYPVNGEKLT